MDNRYTIRIKPYPGESLASYLLRFSKANGINFLSFWNAMRKSKKRYSQMGYLYLLNYLPISVLDCTKTAYMTGLSEEEILKMSMYFVIKRFCKGNNLDRSRVLSGMIREEFFYYCPTCLNEKPYHKLIWTIEGIISCPDHGIPLRKTCASCGRSIKYSDLKEVDLCPHCKSNLSISNSIMKNSIDGGEKQRWLWDCWEYLVLPSDQRIDAIQLACKVLYFLNEKNSIYNREIVSNNIQDVKLLPTLLQHARGTLEQKRTLHLSFILKALEKDAMHIKDLFHISLPKEFIESIVGNKQPKEEPMCLAAWCLNYHRVNSLHKVATSYKQTYNGDFQSYYFICPECGCEYVHNKNGEIIERTDFIEGYHMLKDYDLGCYTLKDLRLKTGQRNEKLRRFIAYFITNGVFKPLKKYTNITTCNELIQKFILDIENNIGIEQIRYKDYWNDHFHYLMHRYKIQVINLIAIQHSKKHFKKTNAEKRKMVIEHINILKNKNIKITVANVCESMGVVHESLRNWGCLDIIKMNT